MNDLLVVKLGSSVLADDGCLPAAAQEIYSHVREGRRVVAVVSAIGRSTDTLVARADALGPRLDPAARAALLATGEARAVALLTLALDAAGIPAIGLDVGRLGLTVEGPLDDATPVSFDDRSLRAALIEAPVVVVPGFLGTTLSGRTALLGRGGSDLSAVFLAERLDAERCVLLKDTDGVHEADPALDPAARRYSSLSFADALKLDAAILQPKAVRYASAREYPFEVRRCGGARGTVVGAPSTNLAASDEQRPIRVVLAGLGTVGGAVRKRLAHWPGDVEVIGALVRNPDRHQGLPFPVVTDPEELLDLGADILVEALGGSDPAATLIEEALRRGLHVVTANKIALAEAGDALGSIARTQGRRLLGSASVGGAVPALETVTAIAGSEGVASIEGVLNGTTNYLLDRTSAGASFADALDNAVTLGLAESDSSSDLDGTDAAAKLALLCRAAFSSGPDYRDIPRSGLGSLAPGVEAEHRPRLVARARISGGVVEATVALESVPLDDELADTVDEGNALRVTTLTGRSVVIRGRGAGGDPTATAVVGDVFEILRRQDSRRVSS